MRNSIVLLFAALVVVSLTLSGCGGGGDGGGTPTPSAVASKGVVTATGSITANGITYDIASAAVTPAGTSIQPGMVVTVKGTFANFTTHTRAKAASVEYAPNLTGPVDSVNPLNIVNALLVMGQPVRVSPTGTLPNKTMYVSFTNISSIKPGNVIEVSGLTNSADGFIDATRIELKSTTPDPAMPIGVKGSIKALDTNGKAFMIGPLTIDYSGISPIQLPLSLANDQYVQVGGIYSDYTIGTAPTLIASTVEQLTQGISATNGTYMSVEGFVSGLAGNTFMVEGTVVNSGVLSLANIVNAVKVRVDGTFSNGTLNASKITLL
jgi:Domain of unknown function (DUF5666)